MYREKIEAYFADKQEQIVAENKGIFGEKARRRKAAQARIAEIDVELGKM